MTILASLTADTLRGLYLNEHLTETDIARRYGTSQVQVGRLRKKFGIPTLVKSDRLNLPEELTPKLRSILIGSMLGDGRLFRTGVKTAAYSEYHCEAQKPYLDWKAAEWGVFVTRYTKVRDDEYKGWSVALHGCRVLHPFWEMFYPDGSGDKTFAHLPLEWVDDLALAVWFMDDGSKAGSYFRFSVTPNKSDQQIQLQILRRLGLTAKSYDEGEDTSIHIQGRMGRGNFLDLVRPHIHPSMAYKLESPELRKAGVAPRDVLSPERLRPLVDRGMTAQAMANVFGVSVQSVCRALDRMGVVRKVGRPKRGACSDYTVEAAKVGIDRLDPSSETYADEVLRILTRTEIPVTFFTEDALRRDAERLRSAPTKLEGCEFVKISWAGSQLCTHFFPHRWDARYRQNPSVRQAWYDPNYLRRAIQFQMAVHDPVTPVRIFRAVQAVVRGPTNFRPSLAKAVVEAFCPPGGLMLDPCAGYGGRAAGTLAAGRRYLGVDPHPEAEASHRSLHGVLGGTLDFVSSPFEDADLQGTQADLVFTSPPYFSVERYADDTSQSWVRYPTWEGWVRGFLHPLVMKSQACLRKGGFFCINTKTIKDGANIYPIGEALVRLATEVGFDFQRELAIPLGQIGKQAQSEPLYVFCKP